VRVELYRSTLPSTMATANPPKKRNRVVSGTNINKIVPKPFRWMKHNTAPPAKALTNSSDPVNPGHNPLSANAIAATQQMTAVAIARVIDVLVQGTIVSFCCLIFPLNRTGFSRGLHMREDEADVETNEVLPGAA